MNLDWVYEPHNLQDVLAAWTNVHLFQCHLWRLTNRLSPGARQGLTGKRQMETWTVTAAAKQLFGHSHFSGSLPWSSTRACSSSPSWGRTQAQECLEGQLEHKEAAECSSSHHPTSSFTPHGRQWSAVSICQLSREVKCCQIITKVYRIKNWFLTCTYFWR